MTKRTIDSILDTHAIWYIKQTKDAITANGDIHEITDETNEADIATKSNLKALLLSEAEDMNNGELDDAHWSGKAIPVESIEELFK